MITALQIGVVIMKYTNVNIKVLALLLLVILTGDVCMMKLTVKMTTHVPLKLVMITALLLLLVNTLKLFAMMTTNAHKTIAALHPVVSLKMFLTNAGLIISVW
jgi:membrane-associated HD superfamily phosphohydrolase